MQCFVFLYHYIRDVDLHYYFRKKKKKYIYHLFVVTFDVIFILLGHAGRVSYVIIYIKIRLLLSAL